MRWNILKYAIIIFAVISIATALLTFSNLFQKINYSSYNWLLISFAIAAQMVSIFLVIFCWKVNLKANLVVDIAWMESLAHIGINSLGKYAPGKIMGSVARGLSTYKRYGNFNGILLASTVEQVAMIHSGLVLYAIFMLFDGITSLIQMLILSIILISFIIIPYVLEIGFRYLKNKNQLVTTANKDIVPSLYFKSYLYTYLILSVVWVSTSLSLYLVAKGVGVDVNFLTSVLATTSAYLSGFAAVIFPAGIGVRESVLVVYMTKITTTSVATSIALILRLINVAIDIVIGLFAIHQGYRYEE